MRHVVCIGIVLALLPASAFAAPQSIDGVWRGTSLCQVKSSPCRDESAAFYVSHTGETYHLDMRKVVDGQEQDIGTIDGRYDANDGILTWATYDRQKHPSTWTFTVKDSHMSGRVVTSDGVLYRLIELDRAQ